MYDILIKLIIVSTLCDLGLRLTSDDLKSKHGIAKIQAASLQVARIHWQPISVFPEARLTGSQASSRNFNTGGDHYGK